MAESHQSTPTSTPQTRPDGPMKRAMQSSIPISRYMFLLPVISSFLASLTLLVIGFLETMNVIINIARLGGRYELEAIRLHFIEIIDIFLVATILYVIASGFLQLFGTPLSNVPSWMHIDSVGDLEHKLIGVLITVLGVAGLARVASWDGESNLLPFGITVSLLILALGYFVTRTGDQH